MVDLRKLYYLVNHEFRSLYRIILVICIVMIALQQVLLVKSMNYNPNRFERFEFLFSDSGCIIVFLVCLFSVCGLCVFNAYSNYTESKSIYTLLTLPSPREYIYFSKIITYAVCFLTLLASQIISAWMGYGIFCRRILSQRFASTAVRPASNGLFLTFIRLDFFRLILPFGVESFLNSLAIFICLICTIYYAVICERSKRYLSFAAVILNPALIILSLVHRTGSMTVSVLNESGHIHVLKAALFLATAFIVYDSLRLIRKSAVV